LILNTNQAMNCHTLYYCKFYEGTVYSLQTKHPKNIITYSTTKPLYYYTTPQTQR